MSPLVKRIESEVTEFERDGGGFKEAASTTHENSYSDSARTEAKNSELGQEHSKSVATLGKALGGTLEEGVVAEQEVVGRRRVRAAMVSTSIPRETTRNQLILEMMTRGMEQQEPIAMLQPITPPLLTSC